MDDAFVNVVLVWTGLIVETRLRQREKYQYDIAYVDQSGSITHDPQYETRLISHALANLRSGGTVWGFSGTVFPLFQEHAHRGGGTNIEAVYAHAGDRKALIVTDGEHSGPIPPLNVTIDIIPPRGD